MAGITADSARKGGTKRQSFVIGAMILLCGNFAVKLIGMFYKVPMNHMLGGVGMNYFDSAYTLYNYMFVLSTAGLSVAISKLVSERESLGFHGDSKKIFRVALVTCSAFGLILSVAMWLLARPFSQAIGNEGAYMSILAISPAVFFVGIMSAFRGYFQGRNNMTPTAVSQIIEAVVKLLPGLLFVKFIIGNLSVSESVKIRDIDMLPESTVETLRRGAAGAVAAVTAGTAVGALYLAIHYIATRRRGAYESSDRDGAASEASSVGKRGGVTYGSIFRRLVRVAVPVTLGASVMSLTNLIDMGVVLNRLRDAGFEQRMAEMLNGSYRNYTSTVFNVPATLISAFTISSIPAIAAAWSTKNREKASSLINSSFRIAVFISIPSGFGLAVMAGPVLRLIFGATDEVAIATPLLSIMGVASIWVCAVSILTAALQASGFVDIPVIAVAVGGIVKLICNYTLVGMPGVNINGAPIGTNLCYFTIMIAEIIILRRKTGVKLRLWDTVPRIACAAALCVASAWAVHGLAVRVISDRLATLAALLTAAAVYVAGLLLLKALKKEDIILLPMGNKLLKLLEKWKCIG